MDTIGVALILACLATVALVAREVTAYRLGRSVISRRRFTLRLVAGMLLFSLFAAVFLGLYVLDLERAKDSPQFFLAYWSGCLLAAVLLIWVMFADLREVEDHFEARQRRIWEDMARYVANQPNTQQAELDNAKHEGDA